MGSMYKLYKCRYRYTSPMDPLLFGIPGITYTNSISRTEMYSTNQFETSLWPEPTLLNTVYWHFCGNLWGYILIRTPPIVLFTSKNLTNCYKKHSYFPLYWLFNRELHFMVYEIIPTIYTWVECHPLYTLQTTSGPFIIAQLHDLRGPQPKSKLNQETTK